MTKFWLVFKHEYLRHVLRKRFLLAVLSVPLVVVVLAGVGFLAGIAGEDFRPVGFVDKSGLFKGVEPPIAEKDGPFPDIQVIVYANSDEAQANLESGEIQAFYIAEPDYYQNGTITMVSKDSPDSDGTQAIRDFLVSALLTDQPEEVANRIVNGPDLVVRSSQDDRAVSERNIMGILTPILTGLLFMISISSSGGYLLQAIVEEKENRTMEIVLTSVSADQLMAGKILGNLSVGLTQIFIWLAAAAGGVLFAVRALPDISGMGLDTTFLWLIFLTFLPAFIMVAALMAMVGASATESREAQQIAGLFTIPLAVPFWFVGSIMNNPNSPLAIGFSLFPLTAPMTLPMRAVYTTLPWWQIALSLGILVLSAIGAILLASRTFRLGMLRYGKKLKLKEIFARA